MDALILVRHAEAAVDDATDPGLSSSGRVQAGALANRLHAEGITEVWHSPRRRARETANVVARRAKVPAWSTDLLDDRTPVPSSSQWAAYPPVRWPWLRSVPVDERDEDGAAMSAAWAQLRRRAEGKGRVVLVTHAFVVAWFVMRELEAPPAAWMRLAISPASITEVSFNGTDSTIRRLNDSHHTET